MHLFDAERRNIVAPVRRSIAEMLENAGFFGGVDGQKKMRQFVDDRC
jgi:hypothetical protein